LRKGIKPKLTSENTMIKGRYRTKKVLGSRKENLWGYRLLPYERSHALGDNFGLQ